MRRIWEEDPGKVEPNNFCGLNRGEAERSQGVVGKKYVSVYPERLALAVYWNYNDDTVCG